MAFPVAVQSAIFYVLACTPCTSARNRYRTKKKFDKERKERAALEIDEPQMYRHPSPFSMNPYWEEDMRMGPSLPKKGRSGRQQRQQREQQQREQELQNSSQRKLTSAGQESAISSHGGARPGPSHGGSSGSNGPLRAGGGEGMLAEPIPGEPAATDAARSGHNTSTSLDRKASGANDVGGSSPAAAAGTSSAGASAGASTAASQTPHRTPSHSRPLSATLVPEDDAHSIVNSMPNTSMSMLEATASTAVGSDTVSVGWNYKRYQREDEELWGTELASSRAHKLMDAIAKASSSAGRLIESARLGTKELRISSPALAAGANTVTDRDRANFYAPTFIHPPVNDYHPPVVSSKPANKDALHWMLQPPPPAKVMEGKVPVSRSTSIASSYAGRKSTGSELSLGAGRKSTGASEVSLTRRMAMEARLRRADSSNSSATVKRTRATSSAQRLNSSSHSGAGARSRSDSLASSVEEYVSMPSAMAGSWSDDDGMLRPTWRFPSTSTQTSTHTVIHSASDGAAGGSNSNGNGNGSAPSAKLETIMSSNTSTKENTVPEASKAAPSVTATATDAKTAHSRAAPASSSSQDSGLGLSA